MDTANKKIDEIDLQNTIADLRREISDLEGEVDDLGKRLYIFEEKERRNEFLIDYIKDRKEHSEAMGDRRAVEIYQDILI